MERYNNYHKHTKYSNIFTPDTPSSTEEYCERAIELGHDRVFTTEHGYGGDVFNAREVCDSYGLQCIFGVEGYIVPDTNPELKDSRNYHIFIAPKDNFGRLKLNKVISRANRLAFYYKPRFILQDLLELDRNGFYLTTACVAGIARDDDGVNQILLPLVEHFRENVFLEIQAHNHIEQIKHNKKVLELRDNFGLNLIHANDSHYIKPEDAGVRLEFLKGKGINYGDEDSFILDYPDRKTIVERYISQGVVSKKDIEDAISNTIIFDECEPINIDRTPKMPTIYPDKTIEEKQQILTNLAYKRFEDIIVSDGIQEKDIPRYKEKLDDCLKVVEETAELSTADYFLLDEKIVDKAVNEYGGILTRSGRGSGGAFYLNRVLGLTQLDSFTTDLPIYPDRFMSTARILENHSYPDIDLNCSKQEPFVRASKDMLGEFGCVPMLAFGTMQISESFRNRCRSLEIPFSEYNEVAKNLDEYENDKKWGPIIEYAKRLVGAIVSASIHPCAFCLMDKDIEEEIGCVKIGDAICAIITSDEADGWKYLKNDYLLVSVWDIISQTFNMIGKPIMSLTELRNSVDDKVWDIYANGLTCTINQVDSDYGTSLSRRYKPKSIDEVAKLTAAIRPSFDSWRDTFIQRKEFSNHNKHMDKLLEASDKYILFQENIMQYFEWLGVSPAHSIGLIKKISKKKIKESDFKELEDSLRQEWIKQTGSVDQFQDNWELIQSCLSYGFNCVSGDTIIARSASNNYSQLNVREMFKIYNDKEYAIKTKHKDLHKKYKLNGYGYALSLFEKEHKIKQNSIVGIKFAGYRAVYKLTTETGKYIICTGNHKFPTPNGELMLRDLSVGDLVYTKDIYRKLKKSTGFTDSTLSPNMPKKGQKGFQKIENSPTNIYYGEREENIKNKKPCEICGCEYSPDKYFEVHHKDKNTTNNNKDNFMWLCNSCHKKQHYNNLNRTRRGENGYNVLTEKIAFIEFYGISDVYDVSMLAPAHNFVVNDGIVTSNSPHALGYAYDSVYGAYLKSHYPLEYYSVVLNVYQDDLERTSKLTKEMDYFHIKLREPQFRYSKADYFFDKDTNIIYKGMRSIKFLNAQCSDELYELRNNQYDSFIDLLIDIRDNVSINSRQIEILIKLDYFREFGNSKELMRIYKQFEAFKEGKAASIKKEKIQNDEVLYSIIQRYSKETDKQFSKLQTPLILKEIERLVLSDRIEDFSIKEKIESQKEYLGYINLHTGREEDRPKLIVLDKKILISKFGKDKGKPWCVMITTQSIGSGIKGSFTVPYTVYKEEPFDKLDTIFVDKWDRKRGKDRIYNYIYKYHQIFKV